MTEFADGQWRWMKDTRLPPSSDWHLSTDGQKALCDKPTTNKATTGVPLGEFIPHAICVLCRARAAAMLGLR